MYEEEREAVTFTRDDPHLGGFAGRQAHHDGELRCLGKPERFLVRYGDDLRSILTEVAPFVPDDDQPPDGSRIRWLCDDDGLRFRLLARGVHLLGKPQLELGGQDMPGLQPETASKSATIRSFVLLAVALEVQPKTWLEDPPAVPARHGGAPRVQYRR